MLSRSLRRWTRAGVHLGSRAKGLLLVQISKTVHSPTNRLFKRDLPCYFWRKSNQNVGVGVRESLVEAVSACRTSYIVGAFQRLLPYKHPHTPGSVHF